MTGLIESVAERSRRYDVCRDASAAAVEVLKGRLQTVKDKDAWVTLQYTITRLIAIATSVEAEHGGMTSEELARRLNAGG